MTTRTPTLEEYEAARRREEELRAAKDAATEQMLAASKEWQRAAHECVRIMQQRAPLRDVLLHFLIDMSSSRKDTVKGAAKYSHREPAEVKEALDALMAEETVPYRDHEYEMHRDGRNYTARRITRSTP